MSTPHVKIQLKKIAKHVCRIEALQYTGLNDRHTKNQETTETKRYLHYGGMEKQFEIIAIWTSNELPVG